MTYYDHLAIVMIFFNGQLQHLNVSVKGIRFFARIINGIPVSDQHIWHNVVIDSHQHQLYAIGKHRNMKLDIDTSEWSQLPMLKMQSRFKSSMMMNSTLYVVHDQSMECLHLASIHSGWVVCQPGLRGAPSDTTACMMGTWIWTTGGIELQSDKMSAIKSTYRWQPGKKHWQKMADMNEARYHHAMVTDGTSLYVIGGANETHPSLATVEVYNVTSNTWRKLTNLPKGIQFGGAVFLPWGEILVVGGKSTTILLYSIAGDSWRQSDFQLIHPVSRPGIALLFLRQPKPPDTQITGDMPCNG